MLPPSRSGLVSRMPSRRRTCRRGPPSVIVSLHEVWQGPRRGFVRRNIRSGVKPMVRAACSIVIAAAAALAAPLAVAAESDLSVNALLLVAARNADAPALDRALGNGASPNARNRLGETALLIALKKDDVAMARRMLDA